VSACPFCAYAAGRFRGELVAYADEHVMVMPSRDQRPGNLGHCLVVPRTHVPNIYTLPDDLAAPVLSAVGATARAAKQAFGADGITVRQNNEPAGGQDVFHLHFHVVPRFLGDDFDVAPYEIVDEATRIEQADALRQAWSP